MAATATWTNAPAECTQDGQGGHGPQETHGRTRANYIDMSASVPHMECTQEGQGGSGPQETQGCTSSVAVQW